MFRRSSFPICALFALLLGLAAAGCAGAQSAPTGARYVASSRGEVYYLAGCPASERLSTKYRVYFRTAGEAEATGYRPSTARGCSTGAAPGARPRTEAAATPAAARAGTCVVSRVYDGDTVTCRSGERIRLLLIDTPEMDQPEIGREARRALLEIVRLGTAVRVEHDVKRQDRYGRTLAYLYREDGRMVNEEMARGGYALVLSYPPNVRHIDRIRRAVEQARAARRGLWAGSGFACTPKDHRADRCE